MQCHCRAPCQTNESSWPGRHAARSRAQALQGSNATLTKRTPGPKSWCEKPRVRSGYIYDIYIYIMFWYVCLILPLIGMMIQKDLSFWWFKPPTRRERLCMNQSPESMPSTKKKIHAGRCLARPCVARFIPMKKHLWCHLSIYSKCVGTLAHWKGESQLKTCDNIQKHMTTHANIWEQLKKWNVWKRLHVANDLMTFQNRLPAPFVPPMRQRKNHQLSQRQQRSERCQ